MRITVLLLFIFISLFTGCKSECDNKDITEVYCFVDVTDTVNLELAKTYFSTEDINQPCHLYKKLSSLYKFTNCSGGIFRLYKINDLGENPFIELKYPQNGSFEADKTDYQIMDDPSVKSFKKDFSIKFNEIIKNETPLKRNTKIFLPICKALNQLKDSKSNRKILIIFSDMLENSEAFSFYKEQNPDAQKTLDKLEELYNQNFPELSKIEVYIVNKRNISNDIAIDRAEKFWTAVFKEHYPALKFNMGSTLELK